MVFEILEFHSYLFIPDFLSRNKLVPYTFQLIRLKAVISWIYTLQPRRLRRRDADVTKKVTWAV